MNYDIKKYQTVVLYIAKEIKRICDANQIHYTMIGGTLIGAVRHKGFIPWDDDMDFVMARKEFDKFVKCCKTQLSDEFMINTWKNDVHYGHGFLKVMLKGTEAVERGKEETDCNKMIYVDVIPFDRIPDSESERKKQAKQTKLYQKFIWLMSENHIGNHYSGMKKYAHYLLKLPTYFMNREHLIDKCEAEMCRCMNQHTKSYTSIAGTYGYAREIVPESLFEHYIELPFEDTSFMAVRDYDLYLKQVFGDYMQLPPVEKRINHGMSYVNYGDFFKKHPLS